MSKSKTILLLACLGVAGLACALAVGDEPDANKTEKSKADKRDDITYHDDEPEGEPERSPIKRADEPAPADAVAGFLVLSNGDRLEGGIHLTRDAVLKFSHLDAKGKNRILRFRLDDLLTIEQVPIKERMEKEWRWLENANDEKVYTGRSYPMRELETILRPKKGPALRGKLTALIFVTNANGRQRFVLHKRQKGKVDTKLEDLLYVKLVDLRPPAEDDDAPKKD
jgi:hypothetical protein